MKNGLLVCAGEGTQKNIGDYIQSLAQEQFYDHVDCYVERERLNEYDSDDPTCVVMNAWFMWHPENFPPSDAIVPFFTSFHIVPNIASRLLTPKVVSYLKRFEPIGARDTGTVALLESYGIKSYFSGCLTLTLGLKYKSHVKSSEILFVDPFYEMGGKAGCSKVMRCLNAFIALFKHFKSVKNIVPKFTCEFHSSFYKLSPSLDKWLHCASFYEAYSKVFSDAVFTNASFISHNVNQSDFSGNDDKMEYARKLIHRYARARFVVTSRIHCGLPCLGIETPVIFVSSDKLYGDKIRSSGRFGGLIDLFHQAKFTSHGVEIQSLFLMDKLKNKKIPVDFEFHNPSEYKEYADKLESQVRDFVYKFKHSNGFG